MKWRAIQNVSERSHAHEPMFQSTGVQNRQQCMVARWSLLDVVQVPLPLTPVIMATSCQDSRWDTVIILDSQYTALTSYLIMPLPVSTLLSLQRSLKRPTFLQFGAYHSYRPLPSSQGLEWPTCLSPWLFKLKKSHKLIFPLKMETLALLHKIMLL